MKNNLKKVPKKGFTYKTREAEAVVVLYCAHATLKPEAKLAHLIHKIKTIKVKKIKKPGSFLIHTFQVKNILFLYVGRISEGTANGHGIQNER